jgi:hypothetical protein
MKALILLALLWGMAGCVAVPRMEASDAPAIYDASRLRGHWMERESREKPRRKEHVSGRDTHKSACKSAPVMERQKGASLRGQKSKRS